MTSSAPEPKILCTTITNAWQSRKMHPSEARRHLQCSPQVFTAITQGTHPMTLIEAAEFGMRLGLLPGSLMRAAGTHIPGRR